MAVVMDLVHKLVEAAHEGGRQQGIEEFGL